MADGFRIVNGGLTRNADVPSGGTAVQVSARDGQSDSLALLDGSTIDRTKVRTHLRMGRDRKIARQARALPDGAVREGRSRLVFFDSTETGAAAIDSQKWVVTTGFTPTVATNYTPIANVGWGAGVVMNNTSSTSAAGTGLMLVSHRWFPVQGRNALLFRARVLHTTFNPEHVIEHGFGSPTGAAGSATATAVNGAHWRRDSEGNYTPIFTINSIEYLGTAVTPAQILQFIPSMSWFYVEVQISELVATYRLATHDGTVINEQSISLANIVQTVLGLPQGIGTWTKSHLQVFHRMYTRGNFYSSPNNVSALIALTSVYLLDQPGPDYRTLVSQYGAGSITSPASGGTKAQNAQVADYANSAAPTALTVSNTSTQIAALGGQWSWQLPIAGAETDVQAFVLQSPVGHCFVCQRITISGVISVAANAAIVLQWGVCFNGNSASLGTGGHFRKTLGVQAWPAAAANVAGSAVPDIVWEGQEILQPQYVGNATFGFLDFAVKGFVAGAAQPTVRGQITVDGYFE